MKTVVARIDPYYQDRYRTWTNVADKLRDSGFDLKLNADDDSLVGDVNVVQLEYFLKDPKLFERLVHRNLIVYERTGCAPVSNAPGVRKMVNDPRVRGWIKDILFRDPALYNAPMVMNRRHLTYIPFEDGSLPKPKPQQINLTDAAIAKVGSYLPIFMYPRMDPFLNQPCVPVSKRRIDLFFAGNMDFPLPQVVHHRRQACEAILKLNRRSAVFTGNLLKTGGYVSIMQQPKMLLSPYGSGGYSWKDFESMYMGIILIKPDNEFSLTYGFDVFDGEKHLVKCKPDFSDLQQVVEKVMDNQAYYDEFAARNREAIYAARDDEKLARDLVALFSGASVEAVEPAAAAQN